MLKGVDLSMLGELERLGAKYRDGGEKKDIFAVLKSYGVNAMRLRIWNDPYDADGNPYGGGTNDFPVTLGLAKRALASGMRFVLNAHYSDFWTDPGKQCKPKAWRGFSGDRLKREVYAYTRILLEKFSSQGVKPDMVQIGNELTYGFLWEDGRLSGENPNYAGMFTFLAAGIQAVRDFDPAVKIILHLDNGGNHELYREWFGAARGFGLDYDVIGLSYYPFWHGTLDELAANMKDLSVRYGKELIIAETSYGYTTEAMEGCRHVFTQELADIGGFPATKEGQSAFLWELMERIKAVPDHKCLGFVYWCPEWIPVNHSTWASEAGRAYIKDESEGGNSWANQSVFDASGNPLPVLTAIRDFV